MNGNSVKLTLALKLGDNCALYYLNIFLFVKTVGKPLLACQIVKILNNVNPFANVGEQKSLLQCRVAAAKHTAQVNPEVHVEAIADFLTEENADQLLDGCDAVLDALDNIPSRRILASACSDAGIPYLYGAIQGWVAQAAISMPGDGLIDILFPEDVVIRDSSVLSFTPALCASMQTALCVRLLTGQPVETGTLYYFDLLHQEFETISMT